MRVVYVNPFSQQVSGPDESLLALLTHVVPLGIDPHVVLPAAGPPVSRYQAAGATVHFAPLAILNRGLSPAAALRLPVRSARGAAAIVRIARQVGATLIHTNMEVVLDGALAATWLRLPHVLHYRGNTLAQPRAVFAALTQVWTALSDRVFCISQATADGIFGQRSRGKIEVVYNPIEIAAFADAASGRNRRAHSPTQGRRDLRARLRRHRRASAGGALRGGRCGRDAHRGGLFTPGAGAGRRAGRGQQAVLRRRPP
jgi:hypothetical protein